MDIECVGLTYDYKGRNKSCIMWCMFAFHLIYEEGEKYKTILFMEERTWVNGIKCDVGWVLDVCTIFLYMYRMVRA